MVSSKSKAFIINLQNLYADHVTVNSSELSYIICKLPYITYNEHDYNEIQQDIKFDAYELCYTITARVKTQTDYPSLHGEIWHSYTYPVGIEDVTIVDKYIYLYNEEVKLSKLQESRLDNAIIQKVGY